MNVLNRSAWFFVLIGICGACVVLYLFEPTHVSFYPRCLLHSWTGLSCPGCGGLRAAHQLLHGHVGAAFRLNPLILLLLPLFAWLVIRELARICFNRTWPSPFYNAAFGWSLVIVVVLFGVARNLPVPALAWMKP